VLDAKTPAATGALRSVKIRTLDASSIPAAPHVVNLLNRLSKVRRVRSGWSARCPAHDGCQKEVARE
jgi:hypothetical protein